MANGLNCLIGSLRAQMDLRLYKSLDLNPKPNPDPDPPWLKLRETCEQIRSHAISVWHQFIFIHTQPTGTGTGTHIIACQLMSAAHLIAFSHLRLYIFFFAFIFSKLTPLSGPAREICANKSFDADCALQSLSQSFCLRYILFIVPGVPLIKRNGIEDPSCCRHSDFVIRNV